MSDGASLTSPAILIIYGVSGDLAKRKLLPALYHLESDGVLDSNFKIFGTSRKSLTIDSYRKALNEFIDDVDEAVLSSICDRLEFVEFDITKKDDYTSLAQKLEQYEKTRGVCFNILHYLAVPPALFEEVIENIGHGNLQTAFHDKAAARLLIEKPFGFDLESGQSLVDTTKKYFTEDQIYRIDHYLGKETVQNIISFRLENALFRGIWNERFISRIEIMATESLGIEGRVDFYERTGALRDMLQSHLLQLLALITMELPSGKNLKQLVSFRNDLLQSIKPLSARDAVRAQYDGYKDEVSNPDSLTETFVTAHVTIDTPKWKNVPITLTTGKKMTTKQAVIKIYFGSQAESNAAPNMLTFFLQPAEGVSISVRAKKPGLEYKTESVELRYDFPLPEEFHSAYESVLYHAIEGERAIFPTSDEILASWRVVQPLIEAWKDNPNGLETYSNAPVDNV